MTVDAPPTPQVAQRTWWCMEELSRVSELNFTYRYVEIDPYEATDGADTKRSLSLAEKVNRNPPVAPEAEGLGRHTDTRVWGG
jgi:hypothetical protein